MTAPTEAMTVRWEGDTWRVLSTGTTRDGKTYAHLASSTRGTLQRNGQNPIQICDWIPSELLAGAAA